MTDPLATTGPSAGTGTGPARRRVLVVFGGRSSEHEVSCMTAREVLAALEGSRYDPVAVGITGDGTWVLQPDGVVAPPAGGLPVVDPSGPRVALAGTSLLVLDSDGTARPFGEVDVAFPLLHGPWGEDGTVQGLFEMSGVPYVGSGVLGSALAMDKAMANAAFSSAGLPQLPYAVVTTDEWETDASAVRESVASLHYPVFVKPSRAGSSMGGTLVPHGDSLAAAIEAAQEFDPKVIVESAVEAREIECGVLQDPDGTLRVSAPGEIAVDHGAGHTFYDFEAKYVDGTSSNVVPAPLDDDAAERVRGLALSAFRALGCEGLARVDFFLVDGRFLINEVNTMPGFTPYSMFPALWADAGIAYPELVDRLLSEALARPTGMR